MQVFAMGGYRVNSCQKYTLGGTPLARSNHVYCQLVDKMKKVENVQKVNVVCLTDGEANPMSYISEEDRWNDGNIEKTVTRSIAHACASIIFFFVIKKQGTKKI